MPVEEPGAVLRAWRALAGRSQVETAGLLGMTQQNLSQIEKKYEMWMSIVTGQATQREAAQRYGVDRSTVVTVCRVAKQGALDTLAVSVAGWPGQSGPDAARTSSS
jgi:DNA-binding XRE family transcriptional regulator